MSVTWRGEDGARPGESVLVPRQAREDRRPDQAVVAVIVCLWLAWEHWASGRYSASVTAESRPDAAEPVDRITKNKHRK